MWVLSAGGRGGEALDPRDGERAKCLLNRLPHSLHTHEQKVISSVRVASQVMEELSKTSQIERARLADLAAAFMEHVQVCGCGCGWCARACRAQSRLLARSTRCACVMMIPANQLTPR